MGGQEGIECLIEEQGSLPLDSHQFHLNLQPLLIQSNISAITVASFCATPTTKIQRSDTPRGNDYDLV